MNKQGIVKSISTLVSRWMPTQRLNRFVAVRKKVAQLRSGHQTEIKMYENHFYKADWKELDSLVEAA